MDLFLIVLVPRLFVLPDFAEIPDEPGLLSSKLANYRSPTRESLRDIAFFESLQPLIKTYPYSWQLVHNTSIINDPPTDLHKLMLAVANLYLNKPGYAAKLATEVLESEEANVSIRGKACGVLYTVWHQEKRSDQMIAVLQHVLDILPDSAVMHNLMGDACNAAGLPNRAAWHWQIAYHNFPLLDGLRDKLIVHNLLKPTDEGPALSATEVFEKTADSVATIRQKSGVGTGFFISRTGLLLSNKHVVAEGIDLTATFADAATGKTVTLPAAILMEDAVGDMALVQVDLGDARVEPLTVGTPTPLRTGDRVVAIGNPGMGTQVLTMTLTEGIVSNLKRKVGPMTYIQTSSAVNPGNSGGPLFDNHGRVIGMVTLKAALDNVGFAIPADTLKEFVARYLNLLPAMIAKVE